MKILVAVISYNEEKAIKSTLEDLRAHNFGYDIVLVDNSSSDDTVRIAEEAGIDDVVHCVNTGSPFGTVKTYFKYADKKGYDILCQFDGDGQHVASEIPKIVGPVSRGEADYVIGSRFIKGEGFQSYLLRRLGISLFAAIDSLIIRQKVTDVTSGFRCYSKRVIDLFANKYKYEIYDTSQLLLLSHFAGAVIMEVPVIMRERVHGKSDYNFINAVAFPINGIINIIGCMLQKNLMND